MNKVEIFTIPEVKLVEKPWGWERWIADGKPDFPYALKEIFFKAPHKSSLQFHQYKQETNYVREGRGVLYYSTDPIDIPAYLGGNYTDVELGNIIKSLNEIELQPGMVVHVLPGFIHRIEAIEDLTLIEASSVELEDVFRLQDDTGRGHGTIENEHTNGIKP